MKKNVFESVKKKIDGCVGNGGKNRSTSKGIKVISMCSREFSSEQSFYHDSDKYRDF